MPSFFYDFGDIRLNKALNSTKKARIYKYDKQDACKCHHVCTKINVTFF